MADIRDHNKDVKELKEKTKQKLDKLVLEKFPKKILELEKLIEEKLNAKYESKIGPEINIPIPDIANVGNDKQSQVSRGGIDKRVFLFPNGVQPCNPHLSELVNILKPFVLDFTSDMRALRFAIQLMIPKVEDGNNFGVEIQEATIRAIGRVEKTALVRFNQFYRYYSGRGTIVSLIARYPHSDDYRKALKEEDEKFFLVLCLIARELRDDYVSLHDSIVKNLEKIKNPRSSQDVNIY